MASRPSSATPCEERELEALEREYIKSLKISLRSSKISTGQSLISSVIMTVLNMVTTYVGITQVLNGQLTLGGYMAFSTLSGYFTSPVSELISMQMSIQEASISMKRLTEIMDYESEQDDDREYTEMESMEGDIEFKDVTFRYGNRTPALDHILLHHPAGKKVAAGWFLGFRQVHHHQAPAQVLRAGERHHQREWR